MSVWASNAFPFNAFPKRFGDIPKWLQWVLSVWLSSNLRMCLSVELEGSVKIKLDKGATQGMRGTIHSPVVLRSTV